VIPMNKRPNDLQVQTLLHDYLTDEEQSSVAGRNPISSINEILREGRFTRDKHKVRVKFHGMCPSERLLVVRIPICGY
jgi:hypothetical protein